MSDDDYCPLQRDDCTMIAAAILVLAFVIAFFGGAIDMANWVTSPRQTTTVPVSMVVPEGHIRESHEPFMIKAVTYATQTTTFIYITWSPSGGYQITGMFTKDSLPADLANLPVYKVSDIEPGPMANKMNELLKGVIV